MPLQDNASRRLEPNRKSLLHRSLDGIAVWVGIATLATAAAMATYTLSENSGYDQLADMAVHQLDLYAAGIESELSKYESLPSIVELDRSMFVLLQSPNDRALGEKVSKSLLNLNVRVGSLAILLMDGNGLVLASSNWYEPQSFVGHDLSDTPFFGDAVRGGQARSFVADATRGAPHCYFARAIVEREQVVGVVAVKVSLESVESTWIEYAAGSQSEKLLVIDENGVVIMSSNPQWRYKTLQQLSSNQRHALEGTDRYPRGRLQPLGLEFERTLAYGTHLARLRDPARPDAHTLFVTEEQAMVRPGWRLMTLSDVADVQRDARRAALGAAALAALLALLALHMLQRRRALAHRLAAREALQRAKDELEVRVQERTAELRDANAALICEIAEHKRTEQILREAQDELVQAGRLALLGRMSAAITHEINQPLTALRALSDNSRRLLAASRLSSVERNLKAIADLTERMGRITAQLKSFARKAPPPSGTVLLCHAVGNTLELFKSRIEPEGVQVHIDVPEGLRVPCDGYRLEQVLLNLIGNALDSMKQSSLKRLTVRAIVSDDRVRVRVSDTGTGLPESVLSHLFEPFFSTKPAGEGLGLGLVISSGIVQEFGSSLRALNLPEGAAFEFDLQLERERIHV